MGTGGNPPCLYLNGVVAVPFELASGRSGVNNLLVLVTCYLRVQYRRV